MVQIMVIAYQGQSQLKLIIFKLTIIQIRFGFDSTEICKICQTIVHFLSALFSQYNLIQFLPYLMLLSSGFRLDYNQYKAQFNDIYNFRTNELNKEFLITGFDEYGLVFKQKTHAITHNKILQNRFIKIISIAKSFYMMNKLEQIKLRHFNNIQFCLFKLRFDWILQLNKLKQKIMNAWQSEQFYTFPTLSTPNCHNLPLFDPFQQNHQGLSLYYLVNFSASPSYMSNFYQTLSPVNEIKNKQALVEGIQPKKQSEIGGKSSEPLLNKSQKKGGNIKANIIRDFIRSMKKDASSILLAKKSLKSDYPIKKFIEILISNFPNENKYIRFKKMIDLCSSKADCHFAQILRIVFLNYLRGDYKVLILGKKKNKIQYLKACREMSNKIDQSL